MKNKYDVVVIGAGAAGYHAAIRCAQLGLKTACVEESEALGGTCLNIGCIPTKFLLHATEYYTKIANEGKYFGINATALHYDIPQMMKRKDEMVAGFSNGLSGLFNRNKIDVIHGKGTIVNPYAVKVLNTSGGETDIDTDNIIMATGSKPTPLPSLDFDGKYVLSSTDAMNIKAIPKKIVIVGAGSIGLEFATIYHNLGSEVVIVELRDTICPNIDLSISKILEQIMTRKGITFHLSTEVSRGKIGDNQLSLITTKEKQSTLLATDTALIAIGRSPQTTSLGLENIGIQKNSRGFINVDGNFRTSADTIFAIGDLVEGPMLAHKAAEEGIAVAEIIAGNQRIVNYMTIPNIIYTSPEVAGIGLTEKDARENNLDIIIGTCLFKTNPRAHCTGDTDGIVKLIAEKNSDRLIGMHIVGPHASELIGEGVIAMNQHATITEISNTTHGHPTLSEAIREAALSAHGRAINT